MGYGQATPNPHTLCIQYNTVVFLPPYIGDNRDDSVSSLPVANNLIHIYGAQCVARFGCKPVLICIYVERCLTFRYRRSVLFFVSDVFLTS